MVLLVVTSGPWVVAGLEGALWETVLPCGVPLQRLVCGSQMAPVVCFGLFLLYAPSVLGPQCLTQGRGNEYIKSGGSDTSLQTACPDCVAQGQG